MEFFTENITTILLVYGAVITVVAVCAFLVPWLKKKGVNVPSALQVAEIGVTGADQITDILKSLFPGNAAISIADKIIDYAKVGVQKAQQLYHINEISKDERKAEAVKFVYDALDLAGIERTTAIEKIVDGAVEAAVLGLGHVESVPDSHEGRGVTPAGF